MLKYQYWLPWHGSCHGNGRKTSKIGTFTPIATPPTGMIGWPPNFTWIFYSLTSTNARSRIFEFRFYFKMAALNVFHPYETANWSWDQTVQPIDTKFGMWIVLKDYYNLCLDVFDVEGQCHVIWWRHFRFANKLLEHSHVAYHIKGNWM